MKYLIVLITSLIATSCIHNSELLHISEAVKLDPVGTELSLVSTTFNGLDSEYWFDGKAEISKYALSQNRYRELHEGEVVLIFVTEDFLTDRQVKNDNYTNKNSVPVLKTNQVRRFATGLYDYSIMTSVFTRADGSATEKITWSSQDWCGQSFAQLNKKGSQYRLQLRSYFESEGDKDISLKADLLEDELMNMIRINPDLIPTGDIKVLPSVSYLRLSHGAVAARSAMVTKKALSASEHQISIVYPDIQRSVSITYATASPRNILSFKESYPSAFDKQIRSTQATKESEIHEAYWKLNKSTDYVRRSDLMITGFSH